MGKLHQITRKVNFMLGSFEGTQRSEVNYIARKIVPDIDYTFTEEVQECTVITALLIQLVRGGLLYW